MQFLSGKRNKLTDEVYSYLEAQLPQEWKGQKKYLTLEGAPVFDQNGRYVYTPYYPPQDREFATYRKGIIDQQLQKEWQGVEIGVSSTVNGFKRYDISSFIIDRMDIEVIASLDGNKVGIRMHR